MYPDSIDKFTEKLNKIDNNTYVIEEEVTLQNRVYEGYLEHDNVSTSSVNVYSGQKLTGEKIDNFILSTPSKTPWKRSIKIFANYPVVYITYETQGDTIEAEDINVIQDSIVNTQRELNRYKTESNLDVIDLKDKTSKLEIGKADKTYVDTELNKMYNKSEVYTKSETDDRIQGVIGSAPSALDTLQEIAKALNNDADFAGTMVRELDKKVEKVTGKQLSTEDYTTTEKNKLARIEAGANNYTHPSTHDASIIVEDSTHRFIKDTERTNWNDANSKKHTHSNKSILDTITQTLIDAWNGATTHMSDAIRHITNEERTTWNRKAELTDIPTKVSELTNDSRFITEADLGNAGYGDMVKSIYDTNNDGVVDKADKVEWSGVLNKPSTYTPTSHNHTKSQITDFPTKLSQFANDNEYMLNLKYQTGTTIVNDSTYKIPYQCTVTGTIATTMGLTSGWWHIQFFAHQDGNGYGWQMAYPLNTPNANPRYRTSTAKVWSGWKEFSLGGSVTWNYLKGV